MEASNQGSGRGPGGRFLLPVESFLRPWIKVKLKANSNAKATVRKNMVRNCVEKDEFLVWFGLVWFYIK